MAVSRKGKGKRCDSDEGKKVPDKGKKSVLNKGKSIIREDDEKEDYENDDYIDDDAEEESGYSSGEGIRVTRKKRHKRIKERFELEEDDYDLLEEANVTGFHRPANLGGEFKRLKRVGHVPGKKSSVPEVKGDEEEDETDDEDEEMEVDEEELDDEELDEYKVISKPQKKSGSRRAQKRNKGSRPSVGERRRVEREALASLNAVTVDSDDNDDNDRESLSRRLLDKQFESSLPEANYFTARDDLLRQTDVPERLQILEEAAEALPSSDLELRQAAEWIFDRAVGRLRIPCRPEFEHLLNVEKPEIVRQIANVLHLVHNEKLEVPFIALYRQEECFDLLKEEPSDPFSREEEPTIRQYKALWAVQEWNKKWLLLQRRKSELQVGFKERVPVDAGSTPETDKLVKNIFRFIEDAESEQVLDDFEAQFNLHFPRDESEILDFRFKRPRFRSLYSIGHQAGLGTITKHFGLASEALGENLKAGYKKHDVLDEAFLPDDLAAKVSSSSRSRAEFRDPASLIRGARHMLAMEISSEPSVREYVRTFYSKNAVVTTKPTPAGIDVIDAFHQFEGVKWINDKPISAFDDEQWLLIQKAEEEKLIDVTVELPKKSIDNIIFDCEQLFLSDGVSCTSKSWNEQRKQILQEAVVTLLLPIMEKETRMILVTRAKQLLLAKCGLQLWNKVSVAPYDPANGDNNQERNEDGPTLRVLACCWGPPSAGTTFVMLDAAGEILNTMHTGYLNIKAVSPEQAQRKENDKARLMKVLTDYKPHIIVLGAAKVQCRYLRQDISDVLFMLVEQHAGDLAEGLDKIKLVYGDESIPSLFESSRISQKQLPGQPGTVRRAVALGRFLQNPVAMVASLFSPKREILSVKFHPLQSFLNDEELYEVLERVMITVVNQVGIDINLAAMHDWLFETLQFVAGLGPRKAEVIRTALTTAGRVLTRNELSSTIRAMEENVFNNCAGFLRVRVLGQTSLELPHQEPLDNTRIHPGLYQMARSLAEAAIGKEARRSNEEIDVDVSEMPVEQMMKNPNIVDILDIEEYAQSVQVEGQIQRIQTLSLIKSELQRGFQEWRKPYLEPTNEESFYLMTGESEETLFPGRIVQATVRKVQEHQVMCMLDCGLLGFIQKEDISDDSDVEPKDKFTEGSAVTCRVKEVKMDKFLVDLTCKESDLRGDVFGDLQNHDKHFKPDTAFILIEQEKIRQKKEANKKKTFKPRPIVHPKFQNLSTEDAIEALVEKDVGDFMIRPSCKGPAHLSITMKVSDGLFSHIDVAEVNKENWDLASFLRLGKTLTIGDDSYKSIDEVITKYVNQIVTHLQAILQFRKYREGNKSEIADALRSEKTENPKIIPYCLSIAHEYPGAFMLSYIRATTPYHEYISLEPGGFRFRKKVFYTVDKLVVYFQSHFHDPPPDKTTNWGEGGRGRGGRGRGGRGRGDRGRGRGRGDRGRGRGDRGRGWGGRDSGYDKRGDRFGNDSEGADNSNGRGHDWNSAKGNDDWGNDRGTTKDNGGGDNWNDKADGGGDSAWGNDRGTTKDNGGDNWNDKADGGGDSAWGNDRGTIKDNGGGDNWNDKADGGGDSAWGNNRGNTSDTGGGNNWNDTADGGGGSAWGNKVGIASKTEEDASGWKEATNAAGGDGGWDSWNDSADGEGGTATKAAGGGGGWDSWNDPPADGGGSAATNTASGGRGASWSDRSGKAGNTEGEGNVWRAATNAEDGGGDWDIGKEVIDKAQDENIIKTAEVDSAWDCGTKSTGGADEGWGSVPASGGGWDAVEGGNDDVSGNRSGGSDKGRWSEKAEGNRSGGSDRGRWSENTEGNRSGGSNRGRWSENAGGNRSGGSNRGRWSENAGGNRSGGSNRGRWNENVEGGGEETNRRGSDQWGASSPAKRPAPSSWNNREVNPGVCDGQGGGSPAHNTVTTDATWGNVTNSAGGGGDGWNIVPAADSGGWDALPTGDKDGFSSHDGGAGADFNQAGRDRRSNSRGRDENFARRQESSSAWDFGLPPSAQSNIPVQKNWGDQSEPPASTGDGWGESLAEKEPDATAASGGDSGWGAPEKQKTESEDSGWGTVDAVAVADDPWGSVGGGSSSGGWNQQGEATGNDEGWDRQQSQSGDGSWGSGGGRGSQNDGGRWESREGRGGGRWERREGRGGGRWGSRGGGRENRDDGGRWGSRGGGREDRDDGGRWGSGGGGRGNRDDGGRWESRGGGRGNRDDGGRWESRGGRGNRDDGGRWGSRGGGRGNRDDGGRWGSRGGRGGSQNDGGQGGRGSQNDGDRWASGSDHWD